MAFCSKIRVALGLSNPGRVSKVENLESFSLPEHARREAAGFFKDGPDERMKEKEDLLQSEEKEDLLQREEKEDLLQREETIRKNYRGLGGLELAEATREPHSSSSLLQSSLSMMHSIKFRASFLSRAC